MKGVKTRFLSAEPPTFDSFQICHDMSKFRTTVILEEDDEKDIIGAKTLYLICSMDTCFTRVNVAHIRMVVDFAPQAKRHASILVVRSSH